MRTLAPLLVAALACIPFPGTAQGLIQRTLPAEQRAAMEACLAEAGKDVEAALECARRLEDGTLLTPRKPPTPPPAIDEKTEDEPPAAKDDEAKDDGAADAEDARTDAERDYEALYGPGYDPVADPTLPTPVSIAGAYDPWERYNRQIHRFNNAVDRTVALPLARVYMQVVPRPVRLGVSNFFSNLNQPVSAVNALLQGKPRHAFESLGRFALNSTLGIGGIFDPASDAKMAHRSEDFGQTMGVWGWERSRYLELPLFGPRTVRDGLGMFGDAPLSPLRQVGDDPTRVGLQGLQLVDLRTQLMSTDSLREGVEDDYALVRDAWSQRRNYQIFGDRLDSGEEGLPEYLLDDSIPQVPAGAMPVLPEGY